MHRIYDKEPEKHLHFSKEIFPEDTSGVVIHNASGNGMINAGIHDGDYIIFDRNITPVDGDVVSATIDDQLVCRRILMDNGAVRFRREDGITPDYTPADYIIHSVAIGLIRMKRFSNS